MPDTVVEALDTETPIEAKKPRQPSPRELEAVRRLVRNADDARAETAARKLTDRYRKSSLAWQMVSIVLYRRGKIEASLDAAATAANLPPQDAEARYNLANLLRLRGRLAEAEAEYRKALVLNPNHCDANLNLGVTLKSQGRPEEAERSYRRALEAGPRNALAHNNLAIVLSDSGNLEQAEYHYRQAIDCDANVAEFHSNLVSVLMARGRLEEAEAACRRALELTPTLAAAWGSLGDTLKAAGRNREAIDAYRKAVALRPDYSEAHNNLLLCLSFEESAGPEELFAAHVEYGRRFEAPLRSAWPRHANSRDPGRTLNIGFVSADLRDHAVAFFLEPLLPRLARTPGLALHAYSNTLIEDETTSRLRGYFARWTRIVGIADATVAAQVEADSIDILVDLSGYSNGNRLPVFARKPAPVQASWLGYPGTTGLAAMDYYFADRFFLPLDRFASQFTEKIVHLPAQAPFLPSREAPPVNPLPALANGYLTLGSFNRPAKLSLAVIALWATLLRALPDARMLIGGLAPETGHSDLLAWFANQGIPPERLRLVPRGGLPEYLALHHEIDFCLDAFPYAGATTTYHALWMGVPTLTLDGATPAGRDGAAVLRHMRLDSFVAEGKDQFVEIGLRWASDLDALAEIRRGLRERFAQSTICRPDLIAASMASAFRTMWSRWCARLPPEAF